MSSVPWSVKGIDRKARETAKDLARRSGMTLGEWLNHVIEYQGEGKVTPLPQTATLNEALERLTARIEAVETRSSLAVTGIDQSVRGLAARIDTAEKTPRSGAAVGGVNDVTGAIKSLEAQLGKIAAQVYENEAAQKSQLAEIRDELGRMARQVEAAGAVSVDGRLKSMEGQIAQAEQRSTKAIEGIGHQVLRMADTLAKQVEGVDQRTTQAVDRLGGEVARIADQLETRLRQADEAQAQSLEKLGSEIERITERLAERVNQSERRSAQALDGLKGEGFTFQPTGFLGERIREKEERTAALLDEARETVDQALEGRREALTVDEVSFGDDGADDEFVGAQAEAGPAPDAIDEPVISPALYFKPSESAAEAEAGEDLDPFALDESEDPFAAAPAAAEAEEEAEPVLAEAAAAPVIYPSEDETRSDYAFAPQDFQIVTDDAAAPAVEAEAEAETDSFAAVDIAAADPFAPAEPLQPADPFSTDDEAFAISDDFVTDEADEAEEGADPFAGSAALPAAQIEDVATLEEAEAFEPGPFGRTDEPADALLEPVAEIEHDLPAGEDEFVAAGAEAEPDAPVSRMEFIERARAAARNASSDDGKRAKGGSFAFSGFGMGRKRSGARLKSGLLMSTAVLVCLGSGLVGAAMLAPLLKDTAGGKMAGKDGEKPVQAGPQAAMMTDPQPIAPAAGTGTPLAGPAQPVTAAKPGEDAALIYAESLELLAAKDKRGVEMLKKAADLGYPQAELQLGHLYETGMPGLPKDLTLARKWTEKAAEAGLPTAMHNLAMLVYNGEGGPKSATLAAQWFRQAAELDQADSQFNLGLLYENGKGVQANPAEAYKWFLLASRGGAPQARAEAKAAAQRVRPLLSPEAQAAAERAALAYGAQTQAAR